METTIIAAGLGFDLAATPTSPAAACPLLQAGLAACLAGQPPTGLPTGHRAAIAAINQATLSHPARGSARRLLDLAGPDGLCVVPRAALLDLCHTASPGTVRHHLSMLKRHDIITCTLSRKEAFIRFLACTTPQPALPAQPAATTAPAQTQPAQPRTRQAPAPTEAAAARTEHPTAPPAADQHPHPPLAAAESVRALATEPVANAPSDPLPAAPHQPPAQHAAPPPTPTARVEPPTPRPPRKHAHQRTFYAPTRTDDAAPRTANPPTPTPATGPAAAAQATAMVAGALNWDRDIGRHTRQGCSSIVEQRKAIELLTDYELEYPDAIPLTDRLTLAEIMAYVYDYRTRRAAGEPLRPADLLADLQAAAAQPSRPTVRTGRRAYHTEGYA